MKKADKKTVSGNLEDTKQNDTANINSSPSKKNRSKADMFFENDDDDSDGDQDMIDDNMPEDNLDELGDLFDDDLDLDDDEF